MDKKRFTMMCAIAEESVIELTLSSNSAIDRQEYANAALKAIHEAMREVGLFPECDNEPYKQVHNMTLDDIKRCLFGEGE